MTKKTLEIWGGFHNVTIPIRVRVDADAIDYLRDYSDFGLAGVIQNYMSKAQQKKVMRHMCGVPGCLCGIHHGWKWSEV